MFNLLPDNLKKAIKSDYHMRFWVLALFMALSVELSFLILIFPSWLISFYKEKDLSFQVDKLSQSQRTEEEKSLTSAISLINNKLSVLNSALEYPKITPILDVVLSKKIGNIHITELVYMTTSATSSTVAVSGISYNREALVSFVKSLEASKVFKNVDLPISNFTKDRDIKFTFRMSVSK